MAAERFTDCIVQDVASPARNSLVGGPFGSDLVSKDYVTSGVPVIRGTNMGHGRWVDGEFAYVSPAKADSLSANCAKPGDLVFTQRGTLGQVALVPENGADRYLISQSQMKLTVDEAKADALFLYYVFTSTEQQEYIRQNAIQTGVPHTNLGILRNTPVLLPPLAEQKAIAAVLGALDDKIELNRRMNATLEAMARALFQSWFVDFDPVRAKLDGRKPVGMDAATAALFPAAFDASSPGRLPIGWRHTTLADVCSRITDGAHQSPKSVEAGLPMASVKDMTDWGINIASCRHISRSDFEDLVANGCMPEAGDILLAKDGATCLDTACEYEQPESIVLLSSVAILRPKHRCDSAYLHTWLGLSSTKTYLKENFVSGSAIPRVVLRDLKRAELLAPPRKVLDAFASTVAPLRKRIRENTAQSHTLATLRDTLLPKLLSGQLNVATER